MSEGTQVYKVTLCVQILMWHSQPPMIGIELPGQLKFWGKGMMPETKSIEQLVNEKPTIDPNIRLDIDNKLASLEDTLV